MIRAIIDTNILVQVLFRPKFRSIWPGAHGLLALIDRIAMIFDPAPSPVVSPAPTDTMFIACSFQAEADVLVTGNARHVPQALYGNTEVVNAPEPLPRLDSGI